MNPGKLSQRIVFEARAPTADQIGGQSTSWALALTAWAKIDPLSGRELFAAQAAHSEVTHSIIVRYQTALSAPATVAAMRIAYQGRVFNIHSALNPGERNEWIVIHASEGLNDG